MDNRADGISTLDAQQTGMDEIPYALELNLLIEDTEIIQTLSEYSEGSARNQYAVEAMKIGISALRHASGRLDAELIQRESTRMLEQLGTQLAQHSQAVHERVGLELKEYFHPESGRLNERLGRLFQQDGELEKMLRQQIGSDDSQLARTLVSHVGENSPLMKLLSPDQSQGLLSTLREVVDSQLKSQRERILSEFSLDNEEGSLARLVKELSENHGQVSKDLQGKIDEVIKEFSLDEENSALSRLVRNVDEAQKTISAQFSLDNNESAFSRLNTMLKDTQLAINKNLTLDQDDSSLARLRAELMKLLDKHADGNQKFQEEVKVSLAKIIATREEAKRSTRHGELFEDAVCEMILCESQKTGDLATATGKETGQIKNCKVGDCVVELGPESAAPGAKIVVEAKQDASYQLRQACSEIEKGRKNRGAQIGLFVFSCSSAPEGQETFLRIGNDLFVQWDPEDGSTDVYLKAALTTARALCIREDQQNQTQAADIRAIEQAVLEIEKRTGNLQEITKSAETIKSSSIKIIDRVRIDRAALARTTELLQEKIADLQKALHATSGDL